MRKEMEYAYQRLPKLLKKYDFQSAYVRCDDDVTEIVLSMQKNPLSLDKWLELETLVKLDVAPNAVFLGKEQLDSLDGYECIKAGEGNE